MPLKQMVNEGGIRQQLIKNKYLGTKIIIQVEKKSADSHFLSGLMKVKSDFLSCVTFKIQNGEVRFWEDKWMGSTSFCEKYINLFNLVF